MGLLGTNIPMAENEENAIAKLWKMNIDNFIFS